VPCLEVIVGSVREGRAGLPIARWFVDRARAHGRFEVELVDLKEIALPMLDEPKHPRLGQYSRESTKAWSRTVSRGDAFVLVTPEYNYGSPPALVNALDTVFAEWGRKPVGFVSYGGVSGGLRGVQMTKQIVGCLEMVVVAKAVAVPFFSKSMRAGVFQPDEVHAAAAAEMLDELLRWHQALEPARLGAAALP